MTRVAPSATPPAWALDTIPDDNNPVNSIIFEIFMMPMTHLLKLLIKNVKSYIGINISRLYRLASSLVTGDVIKNGFAIL